MSKRTLGIVLIAAGALLVAVSLLADTIGIGAQPGIIGWKQILGAAVGAAAGIVGIVLAFRK
jgi:hypothetical protein